MLTDIIFTQFQQQFTAGLKQMLNADELGAFILVLANSMQDQTLHAELTPELSAIFKRLQAHYRDGVLNGAPDDLDVFATLNDSGIDDYGTWTVRQPDPWRTVFNPLRALRPARASKEKFETLKRPFDDTAFHFDKPFLRPEIMGEEAFAGKRLRVMYHKFPFAPYHLLILIEAAAHHPQYLDGETHALLWRLVEETAGQMPNIGIAYNSLGAGASINHLHAHSFLQQAPLAIEKNHWQHNGGETPYPITCHKLTSLSEGKQLISDMHADNQPFNLLYRPGLCYAIPRKPQGSVTLPPWMGVAAWYELSGAFNLSDRAVFETLTADDIHSALQRLAV